MTYSKSNAAAAAAGAALLTGGVAVPAAIGGITAVNAAVGGGLATLPLAAATYLSNITPTWLQTAGSVVGLAQGPLVIATCQKYGTNSTPCQMVAAGIYSGYSANPVGTEQVLQESAQTLSNLTNQTINKLANTSLGNSLLGNPSLGTLDNMYNYNGYYLTSQQQLSPELSPLQSHIQTAADLINQGKYTEAIQLLENQQKAAELGITVDYGYWTPIDSRVGSTTMTNEVFTNIANNAVASGAQHSSGTVTLPSVGYFPATEAPIPEIVVREQATVALEEYVHELQTRNAQLLGVPLNISQGEDEVALYLYNNLGVQLSNPFINRPSYNRQILGIPGYNITNFPNP